MTMEDFLAFAVELGVDGVSLESCFFPTMEASWFRELKARLDDHGLERVYAWGHPQGLEDGTDRSALEDMVAQVGNAVLDRCQGHAGDAGPRRWRLPLPAPPAPARGAGGLVHRGRPRRRTSWGQADGGEPRRAAGRATVRMVFLLQYAGG